MHMKYSTETLLSDISADTHYKLICGEGRALLKHICKTCRYLRTIVADQLLKIKENDDRIISYMMFTVT